VTQSSGISCRENAGPHPHCISHAGSVARENRQRLSFEFDVTVSCPVEGELLRCREFVSLAQDAYSGFASYLHPV
jgi:hypothetical protein